MKALISSQPIKADNPVQSAGPRQAAAAKEILPLNLSSFVHQKSYLSGLAVK